MNNLISIIIPVYNVEKYLTRCLNSVINQTYKNLEIILINDGSIDNSGKICDDYALKDSRIKLLHLKNGGPSYARNKGIEIATGQYIGFVDADDYIDKDMFNLMLSKQKEIDADVVCCNISLVYLNKKIQNFLPAVSDGVVNKDLAMKLAINEMSFGAFLCNKLFKRKMFDNFKLKENIFWEDYEAGTRLIAKADKIFYISNNLYFYFQGNPNSTTHNLNFKIAKDNFNISRIVLSLLKKQNFHLAIPFAKKRLIKATITLIRIIYLNSLVDNKNLYLIKSRVILIKNFKFFLLSDIQLNKKIFCLVFLFCPCILSFFRFLLK